MNIGYIVAIISVLITIGSFMLSIIWKDKGFLYISIYGILCSMVCLFCGLVSS